MTSTDPRRPKSEQWLLPGPSRRDVENNHHHAFDTAFAEDNRPWIEADPQGMLAVLILRRVAYPLLAPYRSDEGRANTLEDPAPVGARAAHRRRRGPTMPPSDPPPGGGADLGNCVPIIPGQACFS